MNFVAAPVTSDRQIHRTVLKNGIVVVVAENSAANIVAARMFVRVGSCYETPNQVGISHLLTSVLTKGTERLSSQQIAEQVESVGASLGADATADYCILSMKTVSTDFPEILELAAELLRSPSFPEAQVELERRLTLQGIRSIQEQPFSVAQQQLRREMYQQHPYSQPSIGTEETVAQLSREDLQHYHQTHFRPDNLIISIVGRITPDRAIQLVQQMFGDWSMPTQADGSIVPLPTAPLPVIPSQPQLTVTSQETQQSIVMLGYLAAPVYSPDYTALKLLNTYLGNGLSSRLFVELREKQGLAYEVSAFYPTRLGQSQFVVYMGTAPKNTAIAIEGLRGEVDRLGHAPLSEDELQTAKNKLLGQYALGKQTNAQIAQILGWYEVLGLGIEFDQRFQDQVAQTSVHEAYEVACRYFGAPYISLVGPEAVVQSVAASSLT